MAKRYLIAAMTGTGTDADPYRPNVSGPYAMVGPQVGNRCLVKMPVADGTAATSTTVADLDDSNPDAPATDVTATALTSGQVSAIKTFLTNNGISVAQFDADGVSDRRALLRFLLRRWLGWSMADFGKAIDGYDAS